MNIIVIGDRGVMGRRYTSILNYLNIDSSGIDKEYDTLDFHKLCDRSDGIIIATPTITHIPFIRMCLKYKVPILCEKPWSTDIKIVREVVKEVALSGTPVDWVHQYKYIAKSQRPSLSHYDYFNHGKDGLTWDCIQIVALSRGDVSLREESPIWDCSINGEQLDLADMDHAYIQMIRDWLEKPRGDLDYILDAHERTHEIAKEFNELTTH